MSAHTGANMAIPQPGGFNIPFAISSHSSTCVTFWNTWPSLAGHRWIVRRVNFSRLGGDLIQNPKTGETTKSLDLEWKSFEGILSLSSMNTRRRIKCKKCFSMGLSTLNTLAVDEWVECSFRYLSDRMDALMADACGDISTDNSTDNFTRRTFQHRLHMFCMRTWLRCSDDFFCMKGWLSEEICFACCLIQMFTPQRSILLYQSSVPRQAWLKLSPQKASS